MNLIGEHCDPRRFLCLPLLFVLGITCMEAAEGSFDIGLGLGFADAASSDAFEGGWDLQFGYEWHQGQSWNVGTQLHVILGWTSASDVTGGTSMSFDSAAVNATFRPRSSALSWIQLKAGVVYADYKAIQMDQSGIGLAAGLGFVLFPESKLRFHFIDYSRYEIEGEGFNIYSISLSLFFY